MDLLKKELQKKREALQSDFGGKKLLKRSEIEQKRLQKLREEERLHDLSKSSSSSSSSPSSSSNPLPSSSSTSTAPHSSSKALTSSLPSSSSGTLTEDEERRIDELVLPLAEVVRRLRLLKQPVTLFGEDDDARLARLKSTLKSGVLEEAADSRDMTEGQTNDFLRDIYDMRRRSFVQPPSSSSSKRKRGDEEGDGDGDGGKDGDGDGGCSSGVDADKDLKRMKANFEELCDEDKILVFFNRLLNEWSQELEEMPEAEKRTAKGKSMVATFKQCARYLNPLFKFCRKKVLPDDIREALLVVVQCCMKRDYLAAMDQYIKLAIGNAPWPIGVTMVGIHERSAREKIYTNSVAHIMNDETTRKYLQSVKRLMTLCQRHYPADPSKSVEFSSLANGSDLHSFLMEEKKGRTSPTEERLLLTAPSKKD